MLPASARAIATRVIHSCGMVEITSGLKVGEKVVEMVPSFAANRSGTGSGSGGGFPTGGPGGLGSTQGAGQ